MRQKCVNQKTQKSRTADFSTGSGFVFLKVSTPTQRGLNNSAYVILLFVSLSVLILRCICIILCKNALVIILLSRLITRIISPWIIWKCYVCIIAYLTSNCNMLFENLHAIFTKSVQTSCDLGNNLL